MHFGILSPISERLQEESMAGGEHAHNWFFAISYKEHPFPIIVPVMYVTTFYFSLSNSIPVESKVGVPYWKLRANLQLEISIAQYYRKLPSIKELHVTDKAHSLYDHRLHGETSAISISPEIFIQAAIVVTPDLRMWAPPLPGMPVGFAGYQSLFVNTFYLTVNSTNCRYYNISSKSFCL